MVHHLQYHLCTGVARILRNTQGIAGKDARSFPRRRFPNPLKLSVSTVSLQESHSTLSQIPIFAESWLNTSPSVFSLQITTLRAHPMLGKPVSNKVFHSIFLTNTYCYNFYKYLLVHFLSLLFVLKTVLSLSLYVMFGIRKKNWHSFITIGDIVIMH